MPHCIVTLEAQQAQGVLREDIAWRMFGAMVLLFSLAAVLTLSYELGRRSAQAGARPQSKALTARTTATTTATTTTGTCPGKGTKDVIIQSPVTYKRGLAHARFQLLPDGHWGAVTVHER